MKNNIKEYIERLDFSNRARIRYDGKPLNRSGLAGLLKEIRPDCDWLNDYVRFSYGELVAYLRYYLRLP